MSALLNKQCNRTCSLAQALDDVVVAGQDVALLRSRRVINALVLWCREFLFDFVQCAQEVDHRVDTVRDFGVSAVLDQKLKVLAGPVEDGADSQTLSFTQLVAQRQTVFRRRFTGEHVVGNCAEREHVQVFTDVCLTGDRFGGHVGRACVFDKTIHMGSRCNLTRDARRGGAGPIADLPVEDLDSRTIAIRIGYQDALRTKATVDHLLVVSEANYLSDLTHEIQPDVDTKCIRSLGKEMVKAYGLGIVLENQGRTEFMLGEAFAAQDSGMLKGLQEFRFTSGCSFDSRAFLIGHIGSQIVNTNSPTYVLQFRVRRLPILVARPLINDLLQDVVADLAMPLRWPNTRLIHCLADGLCCRPIMLPFGLRVQTATFTSFDSREDTQAGRRFSVLLPIAQADAESRCALQFALQIRSRAKDESLDERERPFLLASLLPIEERTEFLRLRVGQDQWIVGGDQPAICLPRPRAGVTKETAWATLDLDQEEPLGREDQQIDFVDAPIVGDELEVGPGTVRLMCWKLAAHEIERIPLPGITRFGGGNPVL